MIPKTLHVIIAICVRNDREREKMIAWYSSAKLRVPIQRKQCFRYKQNLIPVTIAQPCECVKVYLLVQYKVCFHNYSLQLCSSCVCLPHILTICGYSKFYKQFCKVVFSTTNVFIQLQWLSLLGSNLLGLLLSLLFLLHSLFLKG